ncbi:MAG: hypothetical protein ACLQDL_15170 [Spirochaetia bacterium]
MIPAFLLMLLLAISPGTPPVLAQAARVDSSPETILRAVSSFSPRREGSSAEEALLDWIGARVAGMSLHAVPFDFSSSDFEHSFSRCLRVDVPGRSPDSLIIAVPIDAPPAGPSEGDGSINVALALDLLGRVQGTTPPLSLIVLFLGAEYGDADVYPMGSTLFLRDFQPASRAAVVYLNLRGVPDRVLVRGGGKGIVSPFWLMNRCVDSLRISHVPYRLQADEVQAFRLGATDERPLIEPYLRAGYPSVGLEGEYGAARAAASPDMLSALSSFLRAFLESSQGGIPEEWDRHYLLFQAGDFSLIVGEQTYVALFAGSIAAVLLFALIFLQRLKKYARTLRRNIAAIVPLAALAFLFLVAGTYVAQGILTLRGFPSLWRYAPLEFLGLKLCTALVLSAALYNPLRRFPVPRNGSFYSAAALFFLLVETAVVAVFDITFTSYFLWAFFLMFLSTLARKRWAKTVLALPAPFWGIRGIVKIFLVPALPFFKIITLSPVIGNLLVAGACIPFILILLRIGLMFPGRGVLRRGTREPLLAGILLVAAGVLVAHLLIFSPFSPQRPQPIVAFQTVVVDATGRTSSTSLEVESPAPVNGLSLSTPRGPRPLPRDWNGSPVTLERVESPVQVAVTSGQFLQQRTLTLEVDMPSRPRSFSLSIESADDFVLFDSSFPAVRIGPRSYRVLVGAFPPDPLSLQVSLPVGQAFTLTLSAEFDAPLLGVELAARPDSRVDTRVRVVRTLEVKT